MRPVGGIGDPRDVASLGSQPTGMPPENEVTTGDETFVTTPKPLCTRVSADWVTKVTKVTKDPFCHKGIPS